MQVMDEQEQEKLTKRLYSVSEVAKMFDVSDDTVRRMIERGELQAKKVGFQWRIKRESIQKYL